jgi:ABC-type antimicrobial peptide transport system permease subunit
LLRGRYFNDAEDLSKPLVAIVNQALAKKYFPGEDAVGKRFGDTSLSPKSIKQIIGVVEDIRDGSLDSEIWPTVYYPYNQGPDQFFSLVARTWQKPDSVLAALSRAIHQVHPDIGTLHEATMQQRINRSPSAYLHRSSAWLVGGFAGLALLLGAVGLYGVIAYSVSQRTREIGVRMALGAERQTIYRLILKEAGVLTIAGIVIGVACSAITAIWIRKLLFGTPARDAATLIAVAAILGLSAILASFIPARRAASVSPLDALRAE